MEMDLSEIPLQNHSGTEQGDINTSIVRKKYWEKHLSKESRFWFEEDAKYFLHQQLSTPVLNVIHKVDGVYIEDLEGKRYIDMHGNGVHNAGFNNPDVVTAIKKQLDEGLTFCPRRFTNIPAVQLARKLSEITPGELSRVLFCPGGSEAVEMALALAKQVTGRYKTISFWDSFHGAGMAAASVGGQEHFRAGLGPMLPGVFHVEFPNYYRNPWGLTRADDVDEECLRRIKMIMQREPDIAAIIGEPISATPVIPTLRYWQGIKDLCEQYGILLIFDEIIEGLGRTGKMFASEHYVCPDVLVLGKSFGGGVLPFAGIVTLEKFNTCGHRSIGHYTHEKNALCSAAALAEIEYIETHRLWEHAAQLGKHVIRRLNEMKEQHALIGEIVGLGLHVGIDLVRNRKTNERATKEAEFVMYKAMEKGLSFKIIEGNVITLRPALIISQNDMDYALDILEASIREVESQGIV